MPEGPDGPLAAKLSADLPDARQPGKLTAGMKMAAGGNEATLTAVRPCRWRCSARSPRVLRRERRCAGRLSSELRASWGGPTPGKNRLQADLNFEAFSMTAPALQTDVVQLERLHADCQASWQADRVEIETGVGRLRPGQRVAVEHACGWTTRAACRSIRCCISGTN